MADVGVTTVALCWRVERRDGVAVGLTGHDRDLLVDGLVHRAAPGMTPSAIARSGVLEPGAEADTMDVAGALSSAAIGERDLLSGRWDGARVRVFAVDWTDPRAPLTLGEGVIGAVELGEDGFTAELRGASAAFDRPVVEETSPECRATLGDRRCRVAMAGRRRFARVTACEGAVVTLDLAAAGDGDPYAGGLLRWFGGANSGLESAVTASEPGAGATGTTRVTLARAPVLVVVPGVLVELSEGCDRSLATCATRFGNAVNFRGEPYLPGIDLLTRYPGA